MESVGTEASSGPRLLRPVVFGTLAALALVVFYMGIITLAQGWGHAVEQLGDGEHTHHQFKGGGEFDAEDVQAHEHDIGPNGCVFWVQRGKLHIQIGADGQCDRRRCEDEFDQGRKPGDQAAFLTEGATAVGKRAACVRNGRGQLGETEDETGVFELNGRRS